MIVDASGKIVAMSVPCRSLGNAPMLPLTIMYFSDRLICCDILRYFRWTVGVMVLDWRRVEAVT